MENKICYQLILAENQCLETKRLRLRPVKLSDAQDMYEYASDKENLRFVFPAEDSVEAIRKNIATFFMKEPLGKYGLELKTTGKFIGTIDIRIDEANKNGEIGYVLNKNYWGSGYMPEAGSALLALCFDKLNLLRVAAVHDIKNAQSGRVMEKIGMKKEGISPNARFWKDEPVTDAIWGITREEWKQENK